MKTSETTARTFGRRRLWIVGGATIAFGAAATLASARSHDDVATPSPDAAIAIEGERITLPDGGSQWRYVDLAEVSSMPALPPLATPGRVEFDETRTSAVGSPLAGRVEQVLVRLGASVKKGERLFSVRSAQLVELERDIADTRAQVQLRERLAKQARELVELRALPERELLEAEAALQTARLEASAAVERRRALNLERASADAFWVVSPRDGTVVSLDVSHGQEVSPDRDAPLLQLADLSRVVVVADIAERDAAEVQTGTAAQVLTRSGQIVEGAVAFVSGVVDPHRRTVQVRVDTDNASGLLRPNAYVDVTLAPRDEERVRVPATAVVTHGSNAVVFVAQADGSLARTPVRTGRSRDGDVEIVAGLEPGTRIVTRGAHLLLNAIDLAL